MCAGTASSDQAAGTRQSDRSEPTGRDGLVIANYGKSLLVRDDRGGLLRCVARRNVGRLVCGDRVGWEPAGDGTGIIRRREPRATVLERSDGDNRTRPLAANLDRIAVVAAAQPLPDPYLIDKYTVAAELVGVQPLLVVNKSDLLDAARQAQLQERLAGFDAIGYRVLYTSARQGTGMAELREALAGHTGILVGQSGVGKSSLIKQLLPDLDIAIGRLSEASGQGRHTTTVTTLYEVPGDGRLIDSPGVRDFHLGRVAAAELERGFREFRGYPGQCRFHNCRHLREPGCAVAAAAAHGRINPRRLDSYRQLAAAAPNR